ncbi:MAG: isopentenyl-diphosphate delta-isomerase [Armatimonadetes bacterium Cent15-Ar3]|nr:MAG: isopentenyl-diphosphate delta-isomerase [Armatimonadetes bacterium Cent15-Ar3]
MMSEYLPSWLPMVEELLQVVNERGETIGSIEKLAAHQNGGTWHRAISVFLSNSAGEVLIQQRSDSKYHFAGKWANSCCSHPWPGEKPLSAAMRTAERELGIEASLTELGAFRYSASDSVSGLTEKELDHVFVGQWNAEIPFCEAEVAAVRWISLPQLRAEIAANPSEFAPWLGLILDGFEALNRAA